MPVRIRPAPAVLVVVSTIALLMAHRGIADPPASTSGATPARAVLPLDAPATTEPGAQFFLKHAGPEPGRKDPAIKQAVATAGTRWCVIHLSAGTWDTDGLTIGPGGPIRLVGTRGPSGSTFAENTVLTGPIKITGRDVTATDLIFNTPPTPGLAAGKSAVDTLVTITKSPHVAFDRCLFTGSADTALAIDHAATWAVTASMFDDIYRGLFVTAGNNGRLVNCTLVDDRLGHGTNSLTTGRIQIVDSDHLVLFNNALSPRDPDGKVLLLDGCGNDIHSDYNIWNGVITHQYGTEQQSTWQNSFRTLDSWQAHTAAMWGSACDLHSRSEAIPYGGDLASAGQPNRNPFPLWIDAGTISGAGAGAATFAGWTAPAADYFGGKSDASVGCFSLTRYVRDPEVAAASRVRTPGFTVNFPTAGRATVAIFDGDSLVQTVISNRLVSKGPHSFETGFTAAGKPIQSAAGSKLTWRAVLTPETPETFDIAGPGMKLAPGCTGTTLANNPQENGEGIWCDAAGNLYEVAPYDEAGSTILSVDKDGHYRWRNWKHNGTLVTGDDKYIYVIGDTKPIEDGKVPKGTVLLERFPLGGCDAVPWPDGSTGLAIGAPGEITPTGASLVGGKLYVSDGPHDRVLVFRIGSAVPERQIAVPCPAGLVADDHGGIVVCTRGTVGRPGTVSVLDAQNRVVQRSDFADPVDVCVAPGQTYWIADGGTGDVQQLIQWSGKGSLADNARSAVDKNFFLHRLGAGYAGSPTGSLVLKYKNLPLTHVASSDSGVWVRQKEPGYARCRLVRYDYKPGFGPDVGLETLSLEGQNGGFADPRDPSFIYSPDFFRYHVDLATGHWDWDRNYDQLRWNTVRRQVGCGTGAVFYIGDRKFLATTVCNSPTTTSRTVLICRFNGEKPIPCAAVGGKYFGADFEETKCDPTRSGQWVWTDTTDTTGTGVLKPQDVKLVQTGTKDGMPFPDCTWGTYVERDGTIVWPGESIHYLRPRALNKTGTVPVYDWSDAVTIKYQDFPDRDEKFTARVDLDGSIYDLSTTKAQPLPPGYWGMGTVLTKLSPAGKRLWTVPLDITAKGIAVDDHFVYVCSCFGPFINQYTKDGLLVRQFSWGKTDSQFGWFDFPTPINSVTDPKTGDSVITAEEQWMGRIMVFRVPGAVTRLTGEVP